MHSHRLHSTLTLALTLTLTLALAITLTLARYAHRLRFVGRVEALDADIGTLRLGSGLGLGLGLVLGWHRHP